MRKNQNSLKHSRTYAWPLRSQNAPTGMMIPWINAATCDASHVRVVETAAAPKPHFSGLNLRLRFGLKSTDTQGVTSGPESEIEQSKRLKAVLACSFRVCGVN